MALMAVEYVGGREGISKNWLTRVIEWSYVAQQVEELNITLTRRVEKSISNPPSQPGKAWHAR